MHSILDAWQGFEYAPASPILISIPFPTSILQPLRPVKPRIKMLEIIWKVKRTKVGKTN